MPSSPSSNAARRSLLNYIGIAILMAGMILGEVIYWRGLHSDQTRDEDLLLTPETSRVYERNVGMTVGTFGLILDKWTRALASLKEPKPLAITLGAVSIVTAGGCFLLARKFPGRVIGTKRLRCRGGCANRLWLVERRWRVERMKKSPDAPPLKAAGEWRWSPNTLTSHWVNRTGRDRNRRAFAPAR